MRQISRNWTARFGAALVLALVGCSLTYAQDVRTNYMPGTDFSKYRTYTWVDEIQGVPAVGGHPDQILDNQVKQAIDAQMAAKGISKVADGGKPDLLLGYQLMIDQEKQINGFGDSWGGWGGFGGWGPWGEAALAPSRQVLPALTLGLSSLACMTRRQRSSFGSVVPNMRLNPARNRRKTRKDSIRERKNY